MTTAPLSLCVVRQIMLAAMLVGSASSCGDGGTGPARPGPPASLEVTTGDAQSALAGTALTQSLVVTVRDSKGRAVPNVTVSFAVAAGGGMVTPATVVSNASGVAGGVTWTLGTRGGEQRVMASAVTFTQTFTATIQSSFPLELRFFGPTMSVAAQSAFANAANRMLAAITTAVNPVPIAVNLADCGVIGLSGNINETTRGVIIYAAVGPIDGLNKILAQAGPCYIRDTSKLPILGVMRFDEADIDRFVSTGRFEDVVLHEMNHVLGFGTIWTDKGLLANPAYDSRDSLTGSADPRFTGLAATANCAASSGHAPHCTELGVAVEATGGLGTADGHWRESLFDSELMTGFAESTPNMPWSALSVGSFQDLGYSVNLLAADAYTVPSLLAMARMSLQAESATDGAREIVHRAKFEISSSGRVTIINREKK